MASLKKHPGPRRLNECLVTRHYCEREAFTKKNEPYADPNWQRAQYKANKDAANLARCEQVCDTCKRYSPAFVVSRYKGKPNYPMPALALSVTYESDGKALVIEDYTNKWAYEYIKGWEYPLLSPFQPD